MDAVTLYVGDLDAMTAYYRDVLLLEVLDVAAPAEAVLAVQASATVVLGRSWTPLVILRHTPGLPTPRRGEAGLFHTAILFPTEADLAVTVASIAARAPGTFAGSADHVVSKAFYFTDPEGNGIELYWDRSRADWTWVDGAVTMGSLALDPNAFLREHLTDTALEEPGDAVVGHVHLSVGDVPSARAFYVDALGFEVTAQWHGALFVAAGGYHHHLAMNTWNSAGAGPRASSLGLGEVAIVVPTADDVAALTGRLAHHRVAVRDDGAAVSFEDPWRNQIRVSAQG
ncbi:VOC family protein [Pengzhenrongella sicca]|uniref:VOC family protein n=2 Tax=Pengzhenrongella sicca TaxID=2819238 RepID=A0A8A4ZHK3_9MICO|nr:VOC family protein [Pengzhenrongella sicca]QTE31532.1 VOC family protein [Pengzhenrongella sicca]